MSATSGRTSAIAAIQQLIRGGQQWAGYLPVSAKARRTAASSLGECVLLALSGQKTAKKAAVQRC